jgi:hypothetical protein
LMRALESSTAPLTGKFPLIFQAIRGYLIAWDSKQ